MPPVFAKSGANVMPSRNPRMKCGIALCLAALIAGCATRSRTPAPTTPEAPFPAPVALPATTRGQFNIAAGMLDTWNAVGQIVVRTPGVIYEGRAQMLGLYSVRYRDQPFLILTRALQLSDTIRDTTTQVTATSAAGQPIDSEAAAELLALLHQQLPAEIERVRTRQAEEQRAKARKTKKKR